MKKEHINELDITRALAILAVLMIHSTSTPVTTIPYNSHFFIVYVFLNIFSKFAVPVFIFLSGFVLFYNYISKDFTKQMVIHFYKKRIIQIALPFLFFSVFFYVCANYLATYDLRLTLNQLFSVEFLQKLVIGKAYTHLYYIFIIVQFYVLFPIILYVIKKKPRILPHLLWIGFIVQWAFFFFNDTIWHYPNRMSISFSYMFYFLMGGYIGVNYNKWKKFLNLKREHINWSILFLWTVWIVSSLYNVYLYYFLYSNQTVFVNDFLLEFVFVVQSATASIVILQLSFWIYHHWNKMLVNSMINLGALSFGIYLLHPLFLLLYRRIPLSGNSVLFHLWSIGGFLIALFVTWGIVWLIGRYFKYHWIFFGPIPQKIKYKK